MHPFPRAEGHRIYDGSQLPIAKASLSRTSPGYLDVVSKVVPKIWTRTNSAIISGEEIEWELHLKPKCRVALKTA
jgi:hypothetical protein